MATLVSIGSSRAVTVDVARPDTGTVQLELTIHGPTTYGALAYDGPVIVTLTNEETDALIDRLVATQHAR